MQASIEIIPSHKIDKAKWDACVNNSDNGLIYATCDYLNHMADNWHGIVVNDYDGIMPIPWRKKMGVRYCNDVPFVQQLGWIQQKDAMVSKQILQVFFDFVKYGDYAFNFKNRQVEGATLCNNYLLDLSQPYEVLQKNFSISHIRNLKKANREELIVSSGEYEHAIDFFKNLYRRRLAHVTDADFENFRNLCKHLSRRNALRVKIVFNKKNELLSAALFLKDKKRLYNIMPGTNDEGRKTKANFFLMENILKEFAESNLLFDFEGSDIPGVKNFYEKFGATNQPYCKLHFNHLSFPLNLLKR
jgi:hypothetical protein